VSGFDVAKEMRAIRADIPIALTSGRSNQGSETIASSLNIKTWIYKPATIEELSRALEVLLKSGAD
jgi:DNA-binding response OmpR family regulator